MFTEYDSFKIDTVGMRVNLFKDGELMERISISELLRCVPDLKYVGDV